MKVETVFDVDLPVAERLSIRRTRFGPDVPGGRELPRLAVVSGLHGDELEGLYVCSLLAKYFSGRESELAGWIDLYPALNPMGIDSITRNLPFFNVDINRSFNLGEDELSFVNALTRGISDSLVGAAAVVDIHASNIFLRELPQVRISNTGSETLVPLAKKLNLEFVWVHEAVTVLKNTLAHTLNSANTPCLVVEMGVGMRITEAMCEQLVDGILNLAASMGIWKGKAPVVREPLLSTAGEIQFLNASYPGLFVPEVTHSMQVKKGHRIGRIVSPQTGEELESFTAVADSLVFTLREYPVVMEGSLLARLFAAKGTAK